MAMLVPSWLLPSCVGDPVVIEPGDAGPALEASSDTTSTNLGVDASDAPFCARQTANTACADFEPAQLPAPFVLHEGAFPLRFELGPPGLPVEDGPSLRALHVSSAAPGSGATSFLRIPSVSRTSFEVSFRFFPVKAIEKPEMFRMVFADDSEINVGIRADLAITEGPAGESPTLHPLSDLVVMQNQWNRFHMRIVFGAGGSAPLLDVKLNGVGTDVQISDSFVSHVSSTFALDFGQTWSNPTGSFEAFFDDFVTRPIPP